jgi:hypothetical protein
LEGSIDEEAEQEEIVSDLRADNQDYVMNQNNPYGELIIKSLQD